VVFPEAALKIFITASAEARAQRRFLQLQSEGEFVSYETILEDIKKRDEMDATRPESPFKMPEGAVVLDTTTINMEETLAELLRIYNERHKA
jgi:cytidylate kinase